MGIRLGGSCECCGASGCGDASLTFDSPYQVLEAFPSSDQWAAQVTNLKEFYFGTAGDGTGGFKIEITGPDPVSFTVNPYVVTVTNRDTATVVETKTFYQPFSTNGSVPTGFLADFMFAKIVCGEDDPVYRIFTRVDSGNDEPGDEFIFIYETSAISGNYCAYIPVAGPAVGPTIGFRDSPDFASAGPYCSPCGSYLADYDGTTYDYSGKNLVLTISGIPDTATNNGISYSNMAVNNGTYTVSRSCPGCLVTNHIMSVTWTETSSGGTVTTHSMTMDMSKNYATAYESYEIAFTFKSVPVALTVAFNGNEPGFFRKGGEWIQASAWKWELDSTGVAVATPLFFGTVDAEWVDP